MYDLFFADNAAWFTIPAVLGTVVFALRLVLMLVGAADTGLELDLDLGDAAHTDPGHVFQILSFQTLAAFAMGFGWGGLGALHGSGLSFTTSTLIAVGFGLGMVYLLGMLLKGVHDLQSSGNVSINDAMGAEGTVYVTVPGRESGSGQVRLVVGGRQRIYNAVTGGEALSSGSRVRVVGVNENNTVTVAQA